MKFVVVVYDDDDDDDEHPFSFISKFVNN